MKIASDAFADVGQRARAETIVQQRQPGFGGSWGPIAQQIRLDSIRNRSLSHAVSTDGAAGF